MIINIKKNDMDDESNILEVLYEIVTDNLSKLNYYSLTKTMHHRAAWYIDLGGGTHVTSFQVVYNIITNQFDIEIYEIICDDITSKKVIVTSLDKNNINDFDTSILDLTVNIIISAVYICMVEGDTDIDIFDRPLTLEMIHDLGYIDWPYEVNIYSSISRQYQPTDPFCCHTTFNMECKDLINWHRETMVNDCKKALSMIEDTVDIFLQNHVERSLIVSVFSDTSNSEDLISDDFICMKMNNTVEEIYVFSGYGFTLDSDDIKIYESQLLKTKEGETIKEKIVDVFIENLSTALAKHKSKCNILVCYDNRPELNYAHRKGE